MAATSHLKESCGLPFLQLCLGMPHNASERYALCTYSWPKCSELTCKATASNCTASSSHTAKDLNKSSLSAPEARTQVHFLKRSLDRTLTFQHIGPCPKSIESYREESVKSFIINMMKTSCVST
eukprot:5786396-Amphidinium_carterae.1